MASDQLIAQAREQMELLVAERDLALATAARLSDEIELMQALAALGDGDGDDS